MKYVEIITSIYIYIYIHPYAPVETSYSHRGVGGRPVDRSLDHPLLHMVTVTPGGTSPWDVSGFQKPGGWQLMFAQTDWQIGRTRAQPKENPSSAFMS